jgi:hypothetical protein
MIRVLLKQMRLSASNMLTASNLLKNLPFHECRGEDFNLNPKHGAGEVGGE